MSPDIRYSFDHYVSLGAITGDVYAFFCYFTTNTNDWYDSLTDYNSDSFRYNATKTFLDWFFEDTDDKRAYCIIDGIYHHKYLIDDISKDVILDCVNDNKEEYSDQIISKIENNISQIISDNDLCKSYIKNASKLFYRSKRFTNEQLRNVIERPPTYQLIELSPINKIDRKKSLPRKEKKVLAKSASILDKTLGEKKSSMFISGEEIIVEGNRFNFHCRKGYSNKHISLSVYDKDDGIHLVNLCWYIENTPAMDQIAALAMLVMVGNEDEIIKVGNYMSSDKVLLERFPEFKIESTKLHRDVLSVENFYSNILDDGIHTKYTQVLNNTRNLVEDEIKSKIKTLVDRNNLPYLNDII